MDISLWKLLYIGLILVLKFLSTMDRDLIGIFKIDKSMYKSMFTKILPNPVQVLGYMIFGVPYISKNSGNIRCSDMLLPIQITWNIAWYCFWSYQELYYLLLFDVVSFHFCIFVFLWSVQRGLKILFVCVWLPK